MVQAVWRLPCRSYESCTGFLCRVEFSTNCLCWCTMFSTVWRRDILWICAVLAEMRGCVQRHVVNTSSRFLDCRSGRGPFAPLDQGLGTPCRTMFAQLHLEQFLPADWKHISTHLHIYLSFQFFVLFVLAFNRTISLFVIATEPRRGASK